MTRSRTSAWPGVINAAHTKGSNLMPASLITLLMTSVLLAGQLFLTGSVAADWSEERCTTRALKATGAFSRCAFRRAAKEVGENASPDYSRCQRALSRRYKTIDRHCEASGGLPAKEEVATSFESAANSVTEAGDSSDLQEFVPRKEDGSPLSSEEIANTATCEVRDAIGTLYLCSEEDSETLIASLQEYFKNILPEYELALVGENEALERDLTSCGRADLAAEETSFIHLDLTPNSSLPSLPSWVREDIQTLNYRVSDIKGNGCSGLDLGVHTLGLVPEDAVGPLRAAGYGNSLWNGLRVYIQTKLWIHASGGSWVAGTPSDAPSNMRVYMSHKYCWYDDGPTIKPRSPFTIDGEMKNEWLTHCYSEKTGASHVFLKVYLTGPHGAQCEKTGRFEAAAFWVVQETPFDAFSVSKSVKTNVSGYYKDPSIEIQKENDGEGLLLSVTIHSTCS